MEMPTRTRSRKDMKSSLEQDGSCNTKSKPRDRMNYTRKNHKKWLKLVSRGWTITEAARRCGVPESTLRCYVKRHIKPEILTAYKDQSKAQQHKKTKTTEENHKKALKQVKTGVSMRCAAKRCDVPQSTLKKLVSGPQSRERSKPKSTTPKYQPSSGRLTYTEADHAEAVALVKTGVSLRKAAKTCGLPEATLRSHISGKSVRGRSKPRTFTEENLEEALRLVKTGVSVKKAGKRCGIPLSTLKKKVSESHCKKMSKPTLKSRKDKPRRKYTDENHNAALALVNTGVSIRQAAERCGMPESTLRNNINGRSVRGRTKPTLMTPKEEESLFNHISFMAECGYVLSRQQILDLASGTFSEKNGKQHTFSRKWYRLFKGRWPQLGTILQKKPVKTKSMKTTSERPVRYYKELSQVLDQYKIKNRAEHIYNVNEIGFDFDQSPTKGKNGTQSSTATTSQRAASATVIACGSADGRSLPPFFVFKGKRQLSSMYKDGCLPGSRFAMSDSGRSNGDIFCKFFRTHFLPSLGERDPDEYVLLLYDGHKSIIPVPLMEEAKMSNVIIFMLPPETRHLLQAGGDGCFGPTERHFSQACSALLAANPGITVSRYNTCQLISMAYLNSMTASNLRTAFAKMGIFPFNEGVVDNGVAMSSSTVAGSAHGTREEDTSSTTLIHLLDQIPAFGNTITIEQAEVETSGADAVILTDHMLH